MAKVKRENQNLKAKSLNLTIIVSFIASLILLLILTLCWLKIQPGQKLLPISSSSFPKAESTTVQQLPPVKFANQAPLSPASSETFSLDIVPTNDLSALVYRLEILFDPEVLLVKEVTTGDFFQNPTILRKEIDNEAGRVYFSAGITPEEMTATGEPKSKRPFLHLFFTIKASTGQSRDFNTNVSLGQKTLIINQKSELRNLDQIVPPANVTIRVPGGITND